MTAAKTDKAGALEIVRNDDGSASIVGELDGATLVFAHVNASQVDTARVEQGLGSYFAPGGDLDRDAAAASSEG